MSLLGPWTSASLCGDVRHASVERSSVPVRHHVHIVSAQTKCVIGRPIQYTNNLVMELLYLPHHNLEPQPLNPIAAL